MKLVTFDRDLPESGYMSQLMVRAEGQRVLEIRMTQELFHFLLQYEDMANCFDPVAKVEDVRAGYVGVLFGAVVSILPYMEHARLQDWPRDTFLVFHG